MEAWEAINWYNVEAKYKSLIQPSIVAPDPHHQDGHKPTQHVIFDTNNPLTTHYLHHKNGVSNVYTVTFTDSVQHTSPGSSVEKPSVTTPITTSKSTATKQSVSNNDVNAAHDSVDHEPCDDNAYDAVFQDANATSIQLGTTLVSPTPLLYPTTTMTTTTSTCFDYSSE